MSEAKPRPTVQLTLDASAVAAPVHIAAVSCREIVDFYFDAMANVDLSKKPPAIESTFFRFDIRGPELTAESRRALYESWILAKAFQDLMRGLRASLEHAHLFIEIVAHPVHRVKSASTLDDFIAPFRARASALRFPALLEEVNSRLQKPLDFAAAYRSMQRARNCFEHRGGVVGKSDVGKGESMELTFPRMKAYYERRDEEIELEAGAIVNAEDGEADVPIMMRLDIRRRRFNLGERLILTAADFDEIAFACFHFGSQLAARLPSVGNLSPQ